MGLLSVFSWTIALLAVVQQHKDWLSEYPIGAALSASAHNCTVIGYLPEIYTLLVSALFLFLSRDPRELGESAIRIQPVVI